MNVRYVRRMLAIAVPLAMVVGASQAWAASWVLQTTVNPTSLDNVFYAVTTRGTSTAWAVGSSNSSTSNSNTLIEYYNGTSWSQQTSPNGSGNINALKGVKATSTSNAWAVGYTADTSGTSPLILHYNGSTWATQAVTNASGPLYAVSASSSTNAWAVGTEGTDEGTDTPYSEHYDGEGWHRINLELPSGEFSAPYGVAALGSSNVWSAGAYTSLATGQYQSFIERYNGTAWHIVSNPQVGTGLNSLRAISANTSSDIWAVGYFENSSGVSKTLIEHYNGSTWTHVLTPNKGSGDNYLMGVKAVDASNVWAVGYFVNGSGVPRTLILHYNGSAWTTESPNSTMNPNFLYGVAAGTGNAFAVGTHDNSSGVAKTLALHCAC